MTDLSSQNSQEKTRIDVEVPQLPVTVIAQYMRDLSFENPTAPDSLRPGTPQIAVNLGIDAKKIKDPANDHLYETTLALTVKATREEKIVFVVQIAYAALVSVQGVPENYIRKVLYVDIPQMLFPFSREVVASVTGAGGFPPLMLSPVDFHGMYQARLQEGQAEPTKV